MWQDIALPMVSREPHASSHRREAVRVQHLWQTIQREWRIEKTHHTSYDEIRF